MALIEFKISAPLSFFNACRDEESKSLLGNEDALTKSASNLTTMKAVKLKINLTYEILKEFHLDLKLHASTNKVDISCLPELPNLSKDGDQTDSDIAKGRITDYFNHMKFCPQVFNLEIFKKSLLLRNMVIDDNPGEEIDFDRSSREKLFESIKKDKDIFELSNSQDDQDSEDEFY